MQRRSMLTAIAAATLAALPRALRAAAPAADQAADPWQAGFTAARAADPRLIGYDTAPPDGYRTDAVPLQGRLPDGLRGALLRTGPAQHAVAGVRYHHWFDGDGMVQRFGLHDGGVSHRGRYVQTEKFTSERAAGHMLQQAFGTALPGIAPPRDADAMNVANISMLRHAGRTMALWEGGSPYEIDPDELATLGKVAFSADSAGLPFSAHPRRDADGTLWNIGLLPGSGRLILWHLAGDGTLASLDLLPVPRDIGMVHDFVLTERHLLVPLPSLGLYPEKLFGGGASLLDAYDWRPDQPFRLLVIDKAGRRVQRTAELPPGFVFHFGNGWEDAGGTIRVDACWYADPSVMLTSLREAMRGVWQPGTAAQTRLLTIDTASGRADSAAIDASAEFPRFDERHATQRTRQAFTVTSANPTLHSGAAGDTRAGVLRWDRDGGAMDLFDYGAGVFAEEHIFVPRAGAAEGDGWLVGTSLDTATGRTRLAVFNAMRLADGPVALATLPYAVPLGLHGTWAGA